MVLVLRSFACVSVVRVLFTLIVLAVGAPVGLAARMSPLQAQGVVIGTVSERGSLQPIAYAVVLVSGTDNSVTTNTSGRFRIVNVAPGARELQVTALGYRTFDTTPLTVELGSETSVTITMESEPLKVERLIVTATKTAQNSLLEASTPMPRTITKAVGPTGAPGQINRTDSASPNAYSVTENAWDRNSESPMAPPLSRPRFLKIMV